MTARVLLADDDASLRLVLSQALTKEGYAVRATSNVATLSKWIRDGEGDVVVSDVYMGDDSVFDALASLRGDRPELPVIVMSAQSTVSTAMSAAGVGAYEYLAKPFDLDALLGAVRRALAPKPNAKQRASLAHAERDERLAMIGRSPAMQEVYRVMARVANSDLTVLIEGEPGVGKERAARALHDFGRRRSGAFEVISLAGQAGALDPQALFSRLEGIKGGTAYLTGVDGLSTEDQPRFLATLRLLEASQTADVRLIFAAQEDLRGKVATGGFQSDLYYRLNVVALRMPPLRARKEDIGELARAFLVRAKRDGLPERALAPDALEALRAYDWPGNVRELENVLKRIAALAPDPVISASHVRRELESLAPAAPAEGQDEGLEAALEAHIAGLLAARRIDEADGLYERCLTLLERPLIRQTLAKTGGNQIKAAAILGINRNTLRKKIAQLGLATGRDD